MQRSEIRGNMPRLQRLIGPSLLRISSIALYSFGLRLLSIRAGSNDPSRNRDVTTDDAGTAARSAFGRGGAASCRGIAVAITLVAVIGGSPAAAEERVDAERVLEVVSADWNGDGTEDRALLVVSEGEPDQVDLVIYLSAPPDGLRLAVNKKAIAWRGAMSGTQPSLALNERDSLRITDRNDSIGRSRWSRTLTIAWRDGAFIVAGYTFSAFDTLDLDAASECDINLLTGRGVGNGKPFRMEAKSIALVDWTDDQAPAQCR